MDYFSLSRFEQLQMKKKNVSEDDNVKILHAGLLGVRGNHGNL